MGRHEVSAGVVGLGLVGGAALWAAVPSPDVPGPKRPSASTAHPAASVAPPPVAAESSAAPAAAPSVALSRDEARRVAAVEASCDLAPHQACDDRGCVLLLAMPDLDSPLGWAQMIWRSPRFVASTAARDLGVPPGSIPCGTAIAALGADTLAVEQVDGSELWCTGTRPDGTLPTGLCDDEALARYGVRGFSDPGVRRLSFRR